jgi:hypothetical protein
MPREHRLRARMHNDGAAVRQNRARPFVTYCEITAVGVTGRGGTVIA